MRTDMAQKLRPALRGVAVVRVGLGLGVRGHGESVLGGRPPGAKPFAVPTGGCLTVDEGVQPALELVAVRPLLGARPPASPHGPLLDCWPGGSGRIVAEDPLLLTFRSTRLNCGGACCDSARTSSHPTQAGPAPDSGRCGDRTGARG